MNRKLYLEGEMQSLFGKEFSVAVDNVADSLRLLQANFPNFKEYLISCQEKGIDFNITVAGKDIEDKGLLLPLQEGDIVITPVPAGSKSGGAKILTAILIAVLIIINPGNLFIVEGALTTLGTFAAMTGVSLATQGIQQVMAPDPGVDEDEPQSYIFNGAQQNIIEGDPIPLLYGELRVPGRPISFAIRSSNYYSYKIPEDEDQSSDNIIEIVDDNNNIDSVPATNVDSTGTNVDNNGNVGTDTIKITGITGPSHLLTNETATFTITTENVIDGTSLDVSIVSEDTLISTSLGGITTGKVTVTSNQAIVTVTSPLSQLLKITSNSGVTITASSVDNGILAVSSSKVPIVRYTVSGPTTIDETTGPFTYTVTAPYLTSGSVTWAIELNPPVFVDTSGTVTITNGTGTFDIETVADNSTEGTQGPYSLNIYNSNNKIQDILSIYVSDTSLDPETTPGIDNTGDKPTITPQRPTNDR